MKLLRAVENNDLILVKKLISEGYPLNNEDRRGWTAPLLASYYGYVEVIKELIKAGASLDEKSDFGSIALDFNKKLWQSYEIQDLILYMYPDKYKLLEESVGIHKDILLRLKMQQILDI